MKLLRYLLAASAATTAFAAAAADRVSIEWQDPARYTDAKLHGLTNERGTEIIAKELGKFIADQAERCIPAGSTLAITISDVDLAGELEPWRSTTNPDVRYIRGVTPPRFAFSYTLSAADGTILASGEERITDLNFQSAIGINRDDPLFYEKNLWRDWTRTAFRPSVAAN